MAAWAITTHVTAEGSLATVVAAVETYLETLDSTNDPIVSTNIFAMPNGLFVGYVITS